MLDSRSVGGKQTFKCSSSEVLLLVTLSKPPCRCTAQQVSWYFGSRRAKDAAMAPGRQSNSILDVLDHVFTCFRLGRCSPTVKRFQDSLHGANMVHWAIWVQLSFSVIFYVLARKCRASKSTGWYVSHRSKLGGIWSLRQSHVVPHLVGGFNSSEKY